MKLCHQQMFKYHFDMYDGSVDRSVRHAKVTTQLGFIRTQNAGTSLKNI